jgi:hypothetical protein
VENQTRYVHYTNTSVAFQMVKLSDIVNIIIPFFDKYSIQGQKKLDFDDFKRVALMVENKEHLTDEGYNQILLMKEGMNLNRLYHKPLDSD